MRQNKIYEAVTNRIIEQLEEGVTPWQRPWAGGGGLPENAASGRRYRGINTLTLWAAAEAKGFESSLWGTYRQWKSLGGYVRRGEKGTRIIWWNVTTETTIDNQTGEEQEEKRYSCRDYVVFCLDQTGGEALNRFQVERPVREFTDFEPAEDAIIATGADIRHGGTKAYYRQAEDYIRLPVKEAFESQALYYSTALHELAHWTGHESRLNRLDKLARFGDQSYAAEELVAELGASFLTAALAIPNTRTLENSAAYLADWLQVLRSNKRAIFTAASAASAASDFILNFSQVEQPEEADAIPF